ncbi:hypothetical protein ZEAMMB73_Zm00001d019357 [Zea mays]|uniref:Uncharacterized protein n=1 Tax=Zea mays TaxID=4577 RepID=A0A1D6HX42_MAIZE|nr:hypothetical protein ZEAMMB73_Zm00001d019357 [Zea mays]
MASKKASDLLLLLNAATTGSIRTVVRQLFSRLVFSLQMECSLSMEIVSFWLWLEGNGHPDFLARVESLDNHRLRGIAFAGKMFIEGLRRRSSGGHLNSRGSVEEEEEEEEGYFQEEAMEGIVFYLNNFCYEALEDILEIAEAKERVVYHRARGNQVQQQQQQSSKGKAPMMMSTKDLLSKIKASFTTAARSSHEEGSTSSRSMPSPKKQVLRDIENPIDQCLSTTTYPLATLFDSLKLRDDDPEADPAIIKVPRRRQPSIVPRDERTLFVTFSNGYPFTADELNFGGVEVICVEDPIEPRPPLYAHITFFTQETILHILRGSARVKFVIRGKHLWARQFVPKRKKVRN